MRRRSFLAGLVTVVATPLVAEAQRAGKVPRVGMLMPVSPAAASSNIEEFRRGLAERGYSEGQNIALESRFADGRIEPLADLAAELVRLNVDVIVTWGTPAAHAAKRATQTIPIVMAAVAEPVATGLVASPARPGGNLTGVSFPLEMSGKHLELAQGNRTPTFQSGSAVESRQPGCRLHVEGSATGGRDHGYPTPTFGGTRPP